MSTEYELAKTIYSSTHKVASRVNEYGGSWVKKYSTFGKSMKTTDDLPISGRPRATISSTVIGALLFTQGFYRIQDLMVYFIFHINNAISFLLPPASLNFFPWLFNLIYVVGLVGGTMGLGLGLALRRKWARYLGPPLCLFGAFSEIYLPISSVHPSFPMAITHIGIFVLGFAYCVVWPLSKLPEYTGAEEPGLTTTIPVHVRRDNVLDWRERLNAILSKQIHRSHPPRLRSEKIENYISSLILLAIVAALGGVALDSIARFIPNDFYHFLVLVWTVFVTVVFARMTGDEFRGIKQLRMPNASQVLRHDSRRPILYLRSFNLDLEMSRPSALELVWGAKPSLTAEQRLTKVLSQHGPVIAIGKPDEELPAVGAARFYVRHDNWQDTVSDIAAVCQLIVWTSGSTPGLYWEISHLIANTPPEHLIIWAHPYVLRLQKTEREQEWARFRKLFEKIFVKALPKELGNTRFLYFDTNWNAVSVSPSRRSVIDYILFPWRRSQDVALRHVLKEKSFLFN